MFVSLFSDTVLKGSPVKSAAGTHPEFTTSASSDEFTTKSLQEKLSRKPRFSLVRLVRHVMFAMVVTVLGAMVVASEVRGVHLLHRTNLIGAAIAVMVILDIAVLEFLIVAYYRSYNPAFEYKTFATTLGDAAVAPLVALPSLNFRTMLLAPPGAEPSTTVSRVAARTDWIVSIDRQRLVQALPAPEPSESASLRILPPPQSTQEGFYPLEPARSGHSQES